jgi:hypothetical protein
MRIVRLDNSPRNTSSLSERSVPDREGWRHLQLDNIEFTIKRLREPIEAKGNDDVYLVPSTPNRVGRVPLASAGIKTKRTPNHYEPRPSSASQVRTASIIGGGPQR